MDRVIVGIDGSAGSRAALRFAAHEAEVWGAPLVAVEAWEFSPLIVASDSPSRVEELSRGVAEKLHAVLVDELGDGADAVEEVIVEDAPVRALLDTATENDLVVIGSRGRGGFKGVLLGSVGQQIVHYASCPVVVVRDDGRHG